MVRPRTCRDSDPVGRIRATVGRGRRPARGAGRRREGGRMSTTEVALLGAIAGFTIFLGLPMGRVETRSTTTKTLLNGVSAGILAFLLVDILEHAGEVLEDSLTAAQDGASWATFVGLALCYAIGFGVGLMSLLYVSKAPRRRRTK